MVLVCVSCQTEVRANVVKVDCVEREGGGGSQRESVSMKREFIKLW